MRLLSYNMHKGIGGRDRTYDLDRICRVLEHENPDIVCLQEVTKGALRTKHDDQPALLAGRFRSAAHGFQMNVHYREGGYGNLILSRWPILESHHLCLRWKGWKPRGAQLVTIETPDGPLLLANWHLGLRERERHWQVEQLLTHGRLQDPAAPPTLIVGDFNDWPNTLGSAALTDHGFREATKPSSRFRSFPAFLPMLALDKAFTRGGIRVIEARLVRTRLTRRASDHLPLVIDFRLTPDDRQPE